MLPVQMNFHNIRDMCRRFPASRHLKQKIMIDVLAFAVFAVALATPFLVSLMWGQIEKFEGQALVSRQHEVRTAVRDLLG
jgi:hypothetical protein